MRTSSPGIAAALAGAAFLLAGFSTPPPAASGPPIVPYVCEDGRPALAVYESGGDYLHATVQLTYDGRTTELAAAPTLYGMRYRSEAGGAGGLVWSIRGEEARLTEAVDGDDVTAEGRPLARCVRLRSGGAVATAAADRGHGDDH